MFWFLREMNENMDYIIAEHKRVEQTLRHLTVIAERAMEGIVVVDLNGAIRFVNAAWAAMHGYKTREELIGKQISVFHTKEQMKTEVIPFIEEVKRRGQLAGPVEHVRRNGTPFPTEMLMVVFKDQVSKTMGLIGFATDLTEHERTKDELKRYRDRLAELVKQQTDELKAANEQLQHEIAERKQVDERLKQQTDELKAASERLQDLINKVRARGHIGGADVCKAMGSLEAAAFPTNNRRAVLEKVFRENIRLQKPELDDAVFDEGIS